MESKNVDMEYLRDALIDIEIDNLINCKKDIKPDMVQCLIEDIQTAPEVVVIGSRVSTILVSYATYIFNKIGIRTSGYDAADTKTLDNINNIDRSALVISIGFSRYPKSTIVATRFLKNKGYKIIGVTDKKKSPLNELCNYTFNLQGNSYGFTDTYTSAMLLINLVVAYFGKTQGSDVNRHLREFNETAQQLDFYF